MKSKGVMITCYHKEEDPMTLSGIAFDDGTVLTSGHVFLGLATREGDRRELERTLDCASSTPRGSSALRGLTERLMLTVLRDGNGIGRVYGAAGPGREAEIAAIWKCPLVSKTVDAIDFRRDSKDEDLIARLHGVFVALVDRGRPPPVARFWTSLADDLARPRRGTKILVESTPFGVRTFFNSLSTGVVSSLLGEQDCLFVTDANTVTGATGAPAYATSTGPDERGQLLGMVLFQISADCDIPSGLSLVVSLAPVLRRLASPAKKFFGSAVDARNAKVRKVADETVVVVKGGRSQGTGVVVHGASGLVLTCSHVVGTEDDDDDDDDAVVIYHDGNVYPTELVYKTRSDMAYDLALLRIPSPSPFVTEIQFANSPAVLGETVLSAGFPAAFNWNEAHARPTILEGCVAKTWPFMIQTTCRVYPGCSGSPLLRTDGKFLGLFVCNVSEGNRGYHSDMSFAVPAVGLIVDAVEKYVETGCPSHLETFTCNDSQVQRVWRLESSKL